MNFKVLAIFVVAFFAVAMTDDQSRYTPIGKIN